MDAKTIIKIFILIMLFEGCVTSLEPLAISADFADLNLINNKLRKTNSSLSAQQNRQRANTYAIQGVSKINSNDTNELKSARQLFNASLNFDDTRAEIWNYLGDVSMQEYRLNEIAAIKNNKVADAMRYYNKAIVLDSTNNLFYYQRAICYYAMSDTAYFSDYRKSCSLGNAEACRVINEMENK